MERSSSPPIGSEVGTVGWLTMLAIWAKASPKSGLLVASSQYCPQRSDSTSSATARNCNTAASLSLSEGFDSAKAISVPFIKAKPGMAMAAPAAVILKNERRFCIDTVLELLIGLSFVLLLCVITLCYYHVFSERMAFWRNS